MENMGSYVNCPKCGEQVFVELETYQEILGNNLKALEKLMGIGETEHFAGEAKCKCGIRVTASLHVTAEAMGDKCL